MVSDRDCVIDAAFRAHAAEVCRLAFAVVREQQAAEDVTQETFARAYERFATYDPGRPIMGWLHAIATHLAIDRVRHDRVRRWVGLGEPRLIMPRDATAADGFAGIAERDAVARLLGVLPARTCAMLVLRHAYGYDDRSIADLVGTSPGNVRTQVSRAQQRLRSVLAQPREPGGTAIADRRGHDGER